MCAAHPLAAQASDRPATNQASDAPGTPRRDSVSPAQEARAFEQATERIRSACIAGRRIICGRILKALPSGLVVESGYTSLRRAPLSNSWLISGTVQAVPESGIIEGKEAGCVCVGLVFITDLPKLRSGRAKPYDYVVIQGYPTGDYSYESVGNIRRTVRRFSAALPKAIQTNREAAGIQPPNFSP